ncbi:MAG: imidazolonepropionase [Bifidobacteriaceae bacterium]|jgi:imidazolonepropionase|nr:imidazolonepropionase [Bifidobacteriaceae bacterium]
MSLLIRGIRELVTNDPAWGGGPLGLVADAAVVVEDGVFAWVGPAGQAPPADAVVDVGGAAAIPGFVDSHSHLVFAGDRVEEFTARMSSAPYRPGGIRSTVARTRAASDAELAGRAAGLVAEMTRSGTTTVEIKSGYGLTVGDEARACAIAGRLTDEVTFLGAHVAPPEYADDRDAYVDLVTGPMLQACAPHARWIDVFCEIGAFDAEQSLAVLKAGGQAGLGGRLHAAQLGPSAVIRPAIELGVASIDHCTFLSGRDVADLADSGTVATLLPGAEFCTRQPYPDARRLLDAGVTVALATDCNPGTSYTTSMPFCLALAVRELGMTPAEALWAATAGGAAALRRQDVGRVRVAARADLVVLDAPSHAHLMYRPGVDLVSHVYVKGSLKWSRSVK